MISKERILEKAEDLFIKHGVKRVTMDDIATHIGISKKSIYQYFSDKNEMVSVIFEKHIEQSRVNCLHNLEKAENAIHEVLVGSETFCTTIRSMNRHVLFDLEKYHPEVYKRFNEFKNDFLYKSIVQNLERGIREGLYRSDLNLQVITRFRLLNLLLPMNGEVFPEQNFSFSEVERELVTHYLNGIATLEGLALLNQYNFKSRRKESILN